MQYELAKLLTWLVRQRVTQQQAELAHPACYRSDFFTSPFIRPLNTKSFFSSSFGYILLESSGVALSDTPLSIESMLINLVRALALRLPQMQDRHMQDFLLGSNRSKGSGKMDVTLKDSLYNSLSVVIDNCVQAGEHQLDGMLCLKRGFSSVPKLGDFT